MIDKSGRKEIQYLRSLIAENKLPMEESENIQEVIDLIEVLDSKVEKYNSLIRLLESTPLIMGKK